MFCFVFFVFVGLLLGNEVVCWDAKHNRWRLLAAYEIARAKRSVSARRVSCLKRQRVLISSRYLLRLLSVKLLLSRRTEERSPLFLPLSCLRLKPQVERVCALHASTLLALVTSPRRRAVVSPSAEGKKKKSGNMALLPPIKLQSTNEDGVSRRITSNILSRTQAPSLPATKLAST